jgi:hypothetical protein
MLAKSAMFRKPAMLSLTVDRSRFASPEEAHRTITAGSFIPRFMRLLGLSTWLWVLEFQTKTGDGWPHWHLLVDLEDVGGRLDLQHAWQLWRDRWHLGGLDLSSSRFADPQHAVLYITKYLTKMPAAFPTWVILRQKAIRFVGGCKPIGSLTGQLSRARTEPEYVEQPDLPFRQPRTLLLCRMARCEMSASVFCIDGNTETGDGEWKWMGTIPATPDDLFELSRQGLVSMRIMPVDWGDCEMLAISDASPGGVVACLRKVRGELADRDVGYTHEWEQRVADREWSILEHHAAFWIRGAA